MNNTAKDSVLPKVLLIDDHEVVRECEPLTSASAGTISEQTENERLRAEIEPHTLAEHEVRKQKEVLQKIFDHIPVMINFMTSDNQLILVNREWERTLGWTVEELAKAKVDIPAEFYPDPQERKRAVAFMQTNGVAGNFRPRLRDGRVIDTVWTMTHLSDGSIIGFGLDVTERKRAEERLQNMEEAHALLASIVESSNDAIIATDPNGTMLSWNHGATEMYGYQPEEAIGRPATLLYPPEKYAELRKILDQLAQSHCIENFETVRVRKDGTHFQVSLTVSSIRDRNGNIIGQSAIARDITQQKSMESRLKKSEKLLNDSQRVGQTGGFEFNLQTQELAWSDEEFRLFGFQPQDFVPTFDHFVQCVHPEDRHFLRETTERALSTGKIEPYDLRIMRADGQVRSLRVTAEVTLDLNEKPLILLGNTRDVTDQKQAELALRRSEEHFRSLIENASDIIAVIDPVGVIAYESPAIERITGYSAEELVGKNAFDYIHPDDIAHLKEAIRQGISAPPCQISLTQEYRHRHNDGSWRVLESSGKCVIGDSGRLQIIVNSRDVTSSKQVELALQASEKKFRALFESSRDAIMTNEPPTWKFTSANPATVKMFRGKSEEEIVSAAPWEFSPERQPDGRLSVEKGKEMIETALREGSHFFEWTHRRIDGEEFPADVLLTRMEQEQCVTVQATVRDITERMQREESYVRLAMAVEQAAESVVITDLNGTILYVNPAFERTTGYTSKEALGQNPRILKSGKQDAAFYRTMWETLVRGEVWNGHFINKRKDGTLYEEEVVISPVRGPAGTVVNYVAVKRDVTHERQLEQQLLQSQKMEAVGRLAAGVAHDFNNILTVILGYSKMILPTLCENDPLTTKINEIQKAGERAAILTRQLLLFSKKQPVEFRILALNDVISNVDKMVRRLVGENIEVILNLDPMLHAIKADTGQLEQVVMNLAVNSKEAMPDGGRLTIETKNVELDETYASAHLNVRPGTYILLAITDTGCGMTRELQKRLFEPFFTTKTSGTGLGLSTVYGIVKNSEGTIWVYSEPGQGTAFKIYLPAAIDAQISAHRSSGAEPVAKGSETILLVEDEAPVRTLAREVLRSCGYAVLEASDGNEALKVAAAHPRPIHLLVTDMVMPGMGGAALVERFSSERPDLKVVFMSGYTDVAVSDLLKPGRRFIQKPFSPDAMARAVRKTLDGE